MGRKCTPSWKKQRGEHRRFSGGVRHESTSANFFRSSSHQAASSDSFSSVSSIAATETTASSSFAPTTTEESSANASASLTPEQTREKIASDLKNWQENFAKAADKGTEDLEERVKKITDRQIEKQAQAVGEALIIQLEEASKSELNKLKSTIGKIVKALPEHADDKELEKAEENLSQTTRQAGLTIREKAQALRTWKEKYEEKTDSLVSAASTSTLDVLENIRDLGLQEIGMRWAWMDGVTYKDWSKYHEVKKTFDEWTKEVEAVAKNNPGIAKAKEAGSDIEARGMAVAEETAKELSRLKEVGKWKIQAIDTSDDYSTKYVPPKAANVGQKIMDMVDSASEQVVGTSQRSIESMTSTAKEAASDAASSASSLVVGSEPGVVERLSSKFSDASSSASNSVVGTPAPGAEYLSSAKALAAEKASDASKAAVGTSTPAYESVASQASSSASSAASVVSEGVDVSGAASSASSSAASLASKASSKAFAGAMAQKVEERKPILDDVVDDDTTYSEKIQSMVDQAGDRYAEITKAVSEALMKPTSTQGSVESISSVADEQYSSALAAASSVLYGTQQGTAESVTSVAAGKYSEAVAA